MSIIIDKEAKDIHKSIAIEIIEEMKQGKHIQTLLQQDNILKLYNKISEQNSKYYVCHLDLKENNEEKINNFNNNENILYKALSKEIKKHIDFDIELYKFGQSGNNLTRRHGIICNSGFFSSKSTIDKFNKYKEKEKSNELINSVFEKQTYEWYKEHSKEAKGRWTSKKPNRMVIEYEAPKTSKNKTNFFYLYFQTKEQMEEAEQMLMGVRIEKENKNIDIRNSLNTVKNTIENSFILFGMIKLFRVSKQIKKNKKCLNTLKQMSQTSGNVLHKISTSFWTKGLLSRYKEKKQQLLHYYPYTIFQEQKMSKVKLRSSIIQLKSTNPQDYNLTSYYNNSHTFPLITPLPYFKDSNKDEFNDFTAKAVIVNLFHKIGNTFKNIKNEHSNNKGVIFEIDTIFNNENVLIEKSSQYTGYFPDKKTIENSNAIFINKKKNELIFKNHPIYLEKGPLNYLTSQNIFDISNVFINSNNDLTESENNRIIIFGPKLDPKKYFSYKYLNDEMNHIFIDPEKIGLKFNNGKRIQSNEVQTNLFCAQIFYAVIEMSVEEIETILSKANPNKLNSKDRTDYEKEFLFYLTFTIQANKKYSTELKAASIYNNNHFIVEFNNTIVFDIENIQINLNVNAPPNDIKIQLYTIPKDFFPANCLDEQKRSMCKYLNPYFIGETQINQNSIDSGISEYPLQKKSIKQSEDSKLLINIITSNTNQFNYTSPTLGFLGEDYTIGVDSYITEDLDRTSFLEAKKNPFFTRNLIEQCYDVQFKDNTNEILFRPPENMSNKEFTLSALARGIKPKIIHKLIYNKQFKFLPTCEIYSKSKGLKSSNVEGISNIEKSMMSNFHKEGDWVYKAEVLKLRLLSKNLGITKEKEYIQLNYFSSIKEKKKLKSNVIVQNDFIDNFHPISVNSFHIFDMNELDVSELKNFKNYQWKLSFKFKTTKQMQIFLKVLLQMRQIANHHYAASSKLEGINSELLLNSLTTIDDTKKILKLKIDAIDFRSSETLPKDSELEIIISKSQSGIGNKGGKSLLENLELDYYGYRNSLLNRNEIKCQLDNIKSMKMTSLPFDTKPVILAEKFNKGHKNLRFKSMYKEISLKKDSPKEYDIYINLNDNTIKGQILKQYASNVDFKELFLGKNADIISSSIYDNDLNDNLRMKGILKIKAWWYSEYEIKDYEGILTETYSEKIINLDYCCSDGLPFPKGRYEPNVTRRLLLLGIRKKFGNGIYSVLSNKSKHQSLYKYFEQKCIDHTGILNLNSLKSYNPKNIKLNLSSNLQSNTYLKKLCLKILTEESNRRILNLFSKSEWNLFLDNIEEKTHTCQVISLQTKQSHIIDDESQFYKLEENKEKLFPFSKTFKDLVYYGLPTRLSRIIIWEILLDIEKLRSLTEEKLKSIKHDLNEIPSSKEDIYLYFQDEVTNSKITNIIFSLIDNDTNYITLMKQGDNDYECMENVKTITKAFFKWTDLNIYLLKPISNVKRYVYFRGILSIVQRLRYYFGSDFQTFWFIIGFSQCFELFQQQNPLYSDEMSYINIYVLVTKLILEHHLPNIYNKFYELNYPIEHFLSKHLNSLYSEYFHTDLLFPFYDILLFEASQLMRKDDYGLRYLQILCTVPITLFELNENKILQSRSVSELETISEDFIKKSINSQKFGILIQSNINRFFCVQSSILNWFNLNTHVKWDNKRKELENLISSHFSHIQNENLIYLQKLSKCTIFGESKEFINNYTNKIISKFENFRTVYNINSKTSGKKNIGVYLHINKLVSLFSEFPLNELMFIYIKSFNEVADISKIQLNSKDKESIEYNCELQLIKNQSQLFFNIPLSLNKEKYIQFILHDIFNNFLCSFTMDIRNLELMNIEKVTLESNENNIKLLMEITYIKYFTEGITLHDKELYNVLFESPEYYHNIEIENKYSTVEPNKSKTLNNEIVNMIQKDNSLQDRISKSSDTAFKTKESLCEIFLNQNKHYALIDEYAQERKKIFKNKENNLYPIIINEMKDILKTIINEGEGNEKFTENYNTAMFNIPNLFSFKPNIKTKSDLIMNWLKETQTSFEEILYSLVLIDKASYTISEKIFMLFTIAQMKNKIIYDNDSVSIDKVKELFYALYKRYMIYFTKNEINRMIDFAMKDEKLFNIKYVIAYSSSNLVKIEELIYDLDCFPPRTQNKNEDSVYYIELTKQFNIYLNYIINHYNIKSINKQILIAILNSSITTDNNLLQEMKENNCDELKIIIENDNMNYYKTYKINLKVTPIKIEEIENNESISKNNSKQIIINNEIDECLQQENLKEKILDTYIYKTELTFIEFKKLFFHLPFISDLLRVSSMYIKENKEGIDKLLKYLKVSIHLNQERLVIYHFPKSPYKITHTDYNTETPAKLSNSIKDIITIIKRTILQNANASSVRNEVREVLKYIDDPTLFECMVMKGDVIVEKLFYFDCLYSSIYLKNESHAEIKIELKENEMEVVGEKIIKKSEGYGKVFYYGTQNYKWNKCKINKNLKELEFAMFNAKTKIKLKEGNYVEDVLRGARNEEELEELQGEINEV